MSNWRRAPRPFAVALAPLRESWAPETLLADAQRVWREAVGASIAEQAQPVAERSGVLTVACSASAWAHELDLMGPSIVERLNGLLTGGRLERLRCVATPRQR